MSVRHKLIPRKERVLKGQTETMGAKPDFIQLVVPPPTTSNRPVVELKSGSPIGRPQQRLKGAGQVHKHVAHQEKPAECTAAETQFSESAQKLVPVQTTTYRK